MSDFIRINESTIIRKKDISSVSINRDKKIIKIVLNNSNAYEIDVTAENADLGHDPYEEFIKSLDPSMKDTRYYTDIDMSKQAADMRAHLNFRGLKNDKVD